MLKLGTHVDSGWMYHVYQNQAAAYSFLYFFHLSFPFSNIKNFHHPFLRNCKAYKVKLGIHMDNGLMYGVYWNQAAAAYLSHYFFTFLSLLIPNIKIFIFLRNCAAQKVET